MWRDRVFGREKQQIILSTGDRMTDGVEKVV